MKDITKQISNQIFAKENWSFIKFIWWLKESSVNHPSGTFWSITSRFLIKSRLTEC